MRALRSARRLAIGVMAIWAVVFVTMGAKIASLFSGDPAVVALAATLLWFAASFQVFDAVAMVHMCALRSAGNTRYTLWLSTLGAWLVQVPGSVGLGLFLGWGAKGAWLGLTLEMILLAIVSAPRVRRIEAGDLARLDLLLGRDTVVCVTRSDGPPCHEGSGAPAAEMS